MRDKIKYLWLGLVFIFVGVLFIFRDYFGFSYGSIIWIILGFAFFTLYVYTNTHWALVPCVYFLYFGIGSIFRELGFDTFIITTCMFFIVPGLVFLVLFVEKRNNLYLKYSVFFLCVGAFVIANEFLELPALGIAFISAGLGIMFIGMLKKGSDV